MVDHIQTLPSRLDLMQVLKMENKLKAFKNKIFPEPHTRDLYPNFNKNLSFQCIS